MGKRSTKRNGRGQIVSYEIEDTKSQTYGEVLLSNTNAQEFEKYNVVSFRANVDSDIVEFAENEEYKSQAIQINLPLLGLLGRNRTIEKTTAEFVNANPGVDLEFIAEPYIDNELINNSGGGNGGS